MEEGEGGGAPSRLLWVGNVAADVSETLLIQIFGKYGAVDNVSAYPARSYAFVEFRELEDAKEAKVGLQGRLVKGQTLRIEYARPAKPSRYLWIWGVSETITKEQLEAEFKKFGPLDDFRLLRDRNSALAEFKTIEDASAAMKGLNKKNIKGEELRVDFLRSQIGKRGHSGAESLPHNVVDEKLSKEGDPSDTLWIGFPPPSKVDEEGLRRAFILFGEVERITTFADRSYCFVQFRNVDEATRAKEGLQGRLLNDPRILIRFSSNEGVLKRPTKAGGQFFPPFYQTQHLLMGGPRPPFGGPEWPGPNMPMVNRYPGTHHQPIGNGSSGLLGSPPVRPGLLDPRVASSGGAEFFADNRLSPGNTLPRSIPENSLDYGQREPKRVKVGYSEGLMDSGSMYNASSSEDPWMGIHSAWQPPHVYSENTDPSFMATNARQEPGVLWKGSIAKAGVFVCHVQCFAVGKGIDSSLPSVVNCVARASLDMLAQHFYQALDYGLIYFAPESDSDTGPYQEFVSYLGDKHRAGVANLGDGTTMFLVPPSEFSETVLKVQGDCLFGLVMQSQQVIDGAPPQPPVPTHQKTAMKDDLLLGSSAPGMMVPQSHSEAHQDVASSAALQTTRNRPFDDTVRSLGMNSGVGSASMETAPYEAETGSRGGSVQDQLRSVQALWSNLSHQAQRPDTTDTSGLELQTSRLESPSVKHAGGMEQAMVNLQQSGLGDASSATQALLRQALLAHRGAVEADPKAQDGRRDNASEGEASNRFQATLQLAAALLQRMHNVNGSGGKS